MTIDTVPKSFQYTCDVPSCKQTHLQVGEIHNGHYINSTPPDWATVRWVEFGKGWREMLCCPMHAAAHKKFMTNVLGYEEPPEAGPSKEAQ